MAKPYFIMQGKLSFQEEIKKSRFITYVAHAHGKQAALDYLQSIKSLHKTARHHCWAYVAESPENTVQIGCSDDGEPKGTAGKPMLRLLQGTQVGEIVAVVVRYSSGIKLGTGGLVSAYSNGIQQLVPQIESIEKRFYQKYQLACDYAQMAMIESLLADVSGRVINVEYLQSINAIIEVDLEFTHIFIEQLNSLTQGKVCAKKI